MSDSIVNLGQQRNDIMRDRIERKYKHLDKKAEIKVEIARLKTEKKVTHMRLEIEKVKLERERIQLETAKLNLPVNMSQFSDEEEE